MDLATLQLTLTRAGRVPALAETRSCDRVRRVFNPLRTLSSCPSLKIHFYVFFLSLLSHIYVPIYYNFSQSKLVHSEPESCFIFSHNTVTAEQKTRQALAALTGVYVPFSTRAIGSIYSNCCCTRAGFAFGR